MRVIGMVHTTISKYVIVLVCAVHVTVVSKLSLKQFTPTLTQDCGAFKPWLL
jgi:Na+-translocating ferredoxin:NAD+ oxidoreductase RnfE subunit